MQGFDDSQLVSKDPLPVKFFFEREHLCDRA